MFGIGIPELLVLLLIALVIFGANKLPEIGAGLGKAIKNFKKAATEPDEIDISSTNKKISNNKSQNDNEASEK
ncbi:twin-arginine translocase TatA/TatE family subunit [Desulfothermus okinawensis JCM 13304]